MHGRDPGLRAGGLSPAVPVDDVDDVDHTDEPPQQPGLGRRLEHPTSRLWAAFDPATPQKTILPLLCGVPPQLTDNVMLVGAARSRPVVKLMTRPGDLMRSLAHQTTAYNERCVGHVRGPILWSETITAWSSGVGVDDVFICTSPRRDFDVPENRLFAWVLKRLVIAGRTARGEAADWFPADVVEKVREQSWAAQKLLEHRSLRGVSVRRPTGREMQSVRKSRHVGTYEPVLRAAARFGHPFEAQEVPGLVGQATIEHHRVLLAIADRLRARGLAVPQMTVRGDFVASGSLRYRNPDIYVDRRISGLNGMFLGDVRLLSVADETPADDVRPDGSPRRQVRIESNDDADRLIDELLAARAAQREQPASNA